jgi:hypothetical protein
VVVAGPNDIKKGYYWTYPTDRPSPSDNKYEHLRAKTLASVNTILGIAELTPVTTATAKYGSWRPFYQEDKQHYKLRDCTTLFKVEPGAQCGPSKKGKNAFFASCCAPSAPLNPQ